MRQQVIKTWRTPDEQFNRATERAYEGLDEDEKEWIHGMAMNLIVAIKKRNAKVMFGWVQALELIARTGIFLNNPEVKNE